MLDHHGGLETEFAAGFHDLLGLPLRAERAEFVLQREPQEDVAPERPVVVGNGAGPAGSARST